MSPISQGEHNPHDIATLVVALSRSVSRKVRLILAAAGTVMLVESFLLYSTYSLA